ncbi:phosphoribosylglycinamide formyltransferase [Balneolales bacterium ANBcel1]|nr:phosphoribosylglycinamide formyltransferase [Balneolales bacterium ANBcel1]
MKTKRITVFASGSGSNFKAIHQAALNNDIPASITALVSDKPDCGAVTYARSRNIRTHITSPALFAEDVAGETVFSLSRSSESPDPVPEGHRRYAAFLLDVLEKEMPDLIVLAGYLRKIPDAIVDRYAGSIINIHPSLLPKYGGKGWYGMRVHRAVIENGEKESGCTIHYVTGIYDDGPIIAQSKVAVAPDDTPESLAAKVQKQEHTLYPQVIGRLLTKVENE